MRNKLRRDLEDRTETFLVDCLEESQWPENIDMDLERLAEHMTAAAVAVFDAAVQETPWVTVEDET